MSRDGEYRAVLDRLEDGVGVLLIEADGDVLGEHHVDPDRLPSTVAEGAIFDVTFDAGELRELTHRPQATEQRRRELQSRVDDLARRPPGADDESESGPE